MKSKARSRFTVPTGRTFAYVLMLAVIGLLAYFANGVYRWGFIAAGIALFLIGVILAAGDHFAHNEPPRRDQR